MAVEVNRKRLHKHSLPVVMFSLALLALAGIGLGSFQQGSVSTENAIVRGLTTRVLHAEPQSDGLTRLTFQEKTDPAAGSILQDDISEAGSAAQRAFLLQSE